MHTPVMGASLKTTSPFLSSRPRPFIRALCFAIFAIAILFLTLRFPSEKVSYLAQHLKSTPLQAVIPGNSSFMEFPLPDCSIDAERLQAWKERYALGEAVEYAQRHFMVRREPIPRKSMTAIEHRLFPNGFEVVNISSPPPQSACHRPLEIPVPSSPYPESVDASHLLFGISTTYARLHDDRNSPIKEWAHWLTNGKGESNGAGLILRLVDASEEQLDTTRQDLQRVGIDVQVFHSESSVEMAQRYLSLLPTLYEENLQKPRRWLVLCDDDTFFPSMHHLLEKLSMYNHNGDLYIGTLSEDVNNIQRHGSQAYGGAGVFITPSLAASVVKNYEACSTPEKLQEANSGWGPQGDILLRKCLYENTEVRLTLLRDLHQLDFSGDGAGFYEAGLSPLSLHHFKGGMWHEAAIYEGSRIIPLCGEDCFLQRFRFQDDYIVSNGFSVAQYPNGINFDIEMMERTFHALPDDKGWNMDLMMGPGRQSLSGTGRKVGWILGESEVSESSVRQVYIRKADDARWRKEGEETPGNDGVLELIWSV